MKNLLPVRYIIIAAAILGLFSVNLQAQSTFPGTGFNLPVGKTIVITYEVDVNANVCPNGTLGTNISNQSNVSGSNFATVQTDDPSNPAANPSPTLTPVSDLTLGNLVYKDVNKNGIFDGGDTGIDGVNLKLYTDANSNGFLDAGDGASIATVTTAGGGLYAFTGLCPGFYLVEATPSNFVSGGALYDTGLGAALVSSPASGAPDPDNNTDNDDNGDPISGFGVATLSITLELGTEPTNDGDSDNNTNLSLDLGFKTPTTISINDVTLAEGTGGSTTAFDFTVTRTDNADAFSLTVNTTSGSATAPDDYTAISGGTVSFTAGGSLTQTVTVLVNHDNMVEPIETFTVVIAGAPAGIILTDASGLGTINNDDAAVVTLSGGAPQNEGTSLVFTATLNNPVQGGFSVAYTTNNGTATTADNDYTDNDGSLTFTGAAGEAKTITVLTTTDNKVELDETFTVALGAFTGAPAGVTAAGSPQTGTIQNDDAATVSIAANVSQSESTTPQAFSVTLSNPVDVAVTVQFSTSDGTATTADNDYTGIVSQTVTFAAGTTTAQTVNVTIVNDSKVEADEVYNTSIGTLVASGRNVSLGTSVRTGTITNDDAATVTLSGGGTANEGNSGTTPRTFTATLNNAVQGGFTVAYATNDGTATTANNDYVDNDGSLVFAGTAGEIKTFTVNVNGDLAIETDETYTATLGAFTGAPAGVTTSGSPQTATITNDEQDWGDAPTAAQSGFASTYPTLAADNGARHALTVGGLRLGATVDADLDGQPNATASGDGGDEDGVMLPSSLVIGTTANITVNASGAGNLNAWIDYNRDGDWADVGEQIFTNTAVVSGNNALSFAVPGSASLGTSFARFRLSTAAGTLVTGAATDGEVEDYQVNIQNVALSVNDVTVTEGNAGMVTAAFTVSLNNPAPTGGVTFDIATQNNTATTADNDFVANALTGQTIPAGSSTYTFNVIVNGDTKVEANETFFVNVTNVVGAGVADAQGQGTITNDDAAVVTLTGGITQNEGNAGTVTYTFTATLNNAVQSGFTVPYTTGNGTATAGSDYTDNDGSFTFTGTSGEIKTWTVNVNGDVTVELNETFEGALGAISGAPAGVSTAGSPQTATITNDDAATISVAANVSGSEATTPQTFSVTISNPVDVPVTVQFNTADGTAATTDNDYTGVVNQTVTFIPNTTTAQSVPVAIVNDAKVEANETYTGTISGLSASGRNVTLGTVTRTGTITNDDATNLSIAGPVTHDEGNAGTTNYLFSITLSAPVQGGFTVNYNTNDGTATLANSDYVDNDGVLTFAGINFNETQTVTVQVVGDLNIENTETFALLLSGISAPTPEQTAAITITGTNPETGTITNDELDWGDAPTAAQSGFAGTYPTLAANNGARHAEVPGGLRLGATVDADLDGQPNATASGDGADEDGVSLPGALIINTTANITVNVSAAAFLNAWVDFNRDGDWNDSGEQVATNTSVPAGNNALSFSIPATASLGGTFLRVRATTASGTGVDGLAADGEVEDYAINILDNQFSINDPSVTEGNSGTSNLVFTISRTANATASSVDYAITGGTATSGTDYAALAAGTVNFTAGGALTQTVTVTVNGDLIVEDNETVIMTLSNPVNGGISDNTGVGTITNDDAATLTLSGGIAQNEGNAGTVSYVFTATLSAAVQGGFQVPYTTSDGTATAADNDYVDNDGTLNFSGTAGENKTITVLVNGDNKVELNETFTVALGTIAGTSATQIAAITKVGSPQTGTINNDDAATVSIAANVSQSEATTPQAFSVTLSNPVDVAVTVQFSTSDGTATTADNDYTGIGSQTVTFAAGTTTAQTVNVTINNDTKVEADEVYNVAIGTLAASGRNVSLGTSTRTGTIINNDNATVVLSGNVVHPEGNVGLTDYVFTVTLNNPVQGGFSVNYNTNNSSASFGSDYVDNDGNLVFAGTANEVQTITVQGIGDFIVENNESFRVNLNSINGAPIAGAITFGNAQAFGDLLNDEVDYGDAPDSYQTLNASDGARHNAFPTLFLGGATDGDADGQPGISANGDDTDAEGDDEDGVTLPNPLVTNTTANVTVSASSAGKIDGWVDFNNNGNFGDPGEKVFDNVAVVAGNNALSFAVPNGATPSNTFARFRLSSAGGLSFNGAAADGEVEDYAVQIVNTQFSVNDPSVNEGNAGTSNLTFTITRSNNASACSVNYAITGGTATTADNDYQALAAGTASFTAGGALTQTFNVVVNGDVKVELNETVDVTLSAPVNGSILDGSGTGTIINDDAAVITISNVTVTEGDAGTVNATFNIAMSNPADANVVINYATVDGTATLANNDFQNTTGSHTFTPGQVSKQVNVPVVGDCGIEINETFLLRLSALVNNGRNVTFSGSGATLDGTGTINNDDALPVISCPANATRNADPGVCTVSYTIPLPTVSSICGTAVLEFHYRPVDKFNVPTGPYTSFAPSANNTVSFTRGKYEIEWRVTDGSGSSACSFFLTVIDNQPPQIVCPPNQTLNANATCSATLGAWAPAFLSDNCTPNGSITVTQTPPASTVLTGHNTSVVVTLTADDGGNTASCTFTVTLKDVTPPVARCKSATVGLGVTGSITVPPSTVDNGSSDNCNFSLSLSPNTFTCLTLGMRTVTLTATDAGGNTSSCTTKITVVDNAAPTALCKNPTIFLDNTGHVTLTVAQVDNGSIDACGIATKTISRNDFNCSDLAGSAWPVTLTLTDINGNSSSCLSYVTVKDNIAPTAVCEDVTVQLNSSGKVTVYSANLADLSSDNCAVWSYSPVAKLYTTANLGANNLTITVKDYSNNASTCVSVVTVIPFNSPNEFQGGPSRNALEATTFDFSLFPNPTSGEATIEFPLAEDQDYLLRVFDMSGRLVLHRTGEGVEGENSLPIGIGNVAPGVYMVELSTAEVKAVKRLVIQE